MINALLAAGVGLLLMLPPALAAMFAIGHRHRRRQRSRSPIDVTHRLRRPAGTWVRSKLSKLQDDLSMELFTLLMLSLFPALTVLTLSVLEERAPRAAEVVIGSLVVVGLLAFRTCRLVKLSRNVDACKLGLQCEMAVANELDALVRDGWSVFHDVPLEDSNLDHVLVGDAGVYVVETKGRSRPIRKDGVVPTTLTVRGDIVMTPCAKGTFADRGPIAQARRGAGDLERHLKEEASVCITVRPIVVYPGWHVTGGSCSSVPVTSARRVNEVVRERRDRALSIIDRGQVEAWLEKKTRTLEASHLVLLPEHV